MNKFFMLLFAATLLTSAAKANETPLLENQTAALGLLHVDKNKPVTTEVVVDNYNNTYVNVRFYVDVSGCGFLSEDSTFIPVRNKKEISLYTPVKKNSVSTCQGIADSSRPIVLQLAAFNSVTMVIAKELEISIKVIENQNPMLKGKFDSVGTRFLGQ